MNPEENKKELPLQIPEKKNDYKVLFVLISVFILLLISWFYINKQFKTEKSLSVSELSDWKTYINEQYGFGFKYPGNISISQDGPYISQSGTQPNNLDTINIGDVIYIQVFDSNFLKDDYFWPQRPCGQGDFSTNEGNVSYDHIFFNNERTTRVVSQSYDGSLNVYYCINYSKNPLVVTFNKDNEVFANQVLSSFVFTKPDDTSVWKSYKNTELGFEFQYPYAWVVFEADVSGVSVSKYDSSTTTDGISIGIIKDNVDDIFKKPNPGVTISGPKLKTINKIVWKIYESSGVGSNGDVYIDYVLQRGANGLGVSVKKGTEAESIVEKILSTFKFTN